MSKRLKHISQMKSREKKSLALGAIDWDFDKLAGKITIFFGVMNLPFLFVWSVYSLYLALTGLFIILVITALIWLPRQQIKILKTKPGGENQSEFDKERDYLKLLDDTRKTLAQIIGGIFFALGLIITFYTFQLTKERQLAERYFEAIRLLSPEKNMFTRVGVLYDLENISKDSEKLHPAIVNYSTLFIGEQSKVVRKDNEQRLFRLKEEECRRLKETTSAECQPIIVLPQEVCAFIGAEQFMDIIVAARIVHKRDLKTMSSDYVPDLRHGLFNQVDFEGGQLAGANFENACLDKADFSGSILTGAIFRETSVADANFKGANLKNTDLTGMINLTAEQIAVASIDEKTIVRPELEPAKRERIQTIKKEESKIYRMFPSF